VVVVDVVVEEEEDDSLRRVKRDRNSLYAWALGTLK
jgi:hypothetical protein